MPFSSLPTEIVDMILVEAAKNRGITRALRLRFVCKAWSVAVVNAIFRSGIDVQTNYYYRHPWMLPQSAFWPSFFAYRALHANEPLQSPLRMIRVVAERIVALRDVSPDHVDEEVKKYAVDLSHLPLLLNRAGDWSRPSFFLAEDHSHRDRADPEFALLTAAAYMNDIPLVSKLTGPRPRCYGKQFSVLGNPLHAAAYKGHVEITSFLMNHGDAIFGCRDCQLSVILYASKGNQVDALKVGLTPWLKQKALPADASALPKVLVDLRRDERQLGGALWATNNAEVFEILLKHFKESQLCSYQSWEDMFSLQVICAAQEGAFSRLKQLVFHGASVNGYTKDTMVGRRGSFGSPITLAALHGHEEVVRFLLDRGAEVDGSLAAAVAYGSPKIVRLLLQYDTQSHHASQYAFLRTIKNEDERLFRLLIAHRVVFDERTRREAECIAGENGLDSMMSLLEEGSARSWRQNLPRACKRTKYTR